MIRLRLFAAAALLLPAAALAKDAVRVVDTQASLYSDYALYVAEEQGYYAAENLDVSIIVGRGGSASLQAAVTGSADIVYGLGVLSVIGAYAKGTPVVIVANAYRGAADTFWYVKADSPIKSIKDLDGKKIAIASPGSFSHLMIDTIAREHGFKPQLVGVGAFAAGRTQLMTGQIDVMFSVFPTYIDMVRKGETRMIMTGDAAPSLRAASGRVVAANSGWLAKNRDIGVRAMRAIWKGQLYALSNPAALAGFAKKWNVDLEDAKRALEFYKLDMVTNAPIGNLDLLLSLAKMYGFINEPLTAEQKAKLVDILYDPDSKK